MQGFIMPVVNGVWKVALLLKCCSAPASMTPDAEEDYPPLGARMGQSSTYDSERRRALALQAIDERMGQKDADSESANTNPGQEEAEESHV